MLLTVPMAGEDGTYYGVCGFEISESYFSRRFLSPILRSLEQLKTESEMAAFIDIPEIADLFEFLAQKDREHDASLSVLNEEKKAAEGEKKLCAGNTGKFSSNTKKPSESSMKRKIR